MLLFQDISSNEITHLPSQIGDLESLKSLNVRRNKLVEIPRGTVERDATICVPHCTTYDMVFTVHMYWAWCLVFGRNQALEPADTRRRQQPHTRAAARAASRDVTADAASGE